MAKSERQKALEKALAQTRKKLKGVVRIVDSSEIPTPHNTKRPTGIPGLDLRGLKGGLFGGNVIQLFGPDGTGKDALVNGAIAENQKIYGDDSAVLWMSFGYPADLDFMRRRGVSVPYSASEKVAIAEGRQSTQFAHLTQEIGTLQFLSLDGNTKEGAEMPAESLLSAALAIIETGLFQLVIINELGSGETKHNVVKDLGEEARMASWASLVTQFCQKYYTAIRKPTALGEVNETTVVVINPVRANLDARSAKYNPHSQGGGHALKHAKAVDIHITPRGKIKQGAGGPIIGKTIHWRISKGKHGISEGAEGTYDYYFEDGIDTVKDLAELAKEVGLITRRGALYNLYGFEGDIKGGIAGVIEMIKGDEELQEWLRKYTYMAYTSSIENAKAAIDKEYGLDDESENDGAEEG